MIKKFCLKATFIVALLILLSSCSDDEPVTALQGDITSQIAKLNDAGSFLSFNLKLMDGDQPVPDAEVVLSSGQGDSLITYSKVTDANGIAFFETVKIGGNILSISKEGYFSILGVVDFRFEEGYNYDIADNQVVVIPRSESAIVPFYSSTADGAATATVKGNVTIETDLTNDTPEVPTGTTIKADFSKEVINTSSGVNISEYTISSASKIGSGQVNEDGTYEINIPVSLNGSEISLIIPEIQAQQTLAITSENGEALEEPEIREVLTSFGSGSTPSSVPYVHGAKAVFEDPAPEGSGFQITNFQKAGRPLFKNFTGYYYYGSLYPSNTIQSQGEMQFRFTGGSGYQTTPELTVNDPTGSGFDSYIRMSFAVQGMTVTNEGLYDANEYVSASIYIQYRDSYSNYFASFDVNANSEGKITQELVSEAVQERIDNGYSRWGDNFRSVYNEVDSFYIVFNTSYYISGVQATASLNMNGLINEIDINNWGSNYSNPEFVFTGGDPATPASIEVIEFPTPWSFELDNSAVVPYVLVPNIDFEYLQSGTGDYEINNGNVYDSATYSTYPIENLLETDSEGNLVYQSDYNLVTAFYSLEAPTAFVSDQTHYPMEAEVMMDEDGSVTSLYMTNNGRGYTSRPQVSIVPTIEGLPGEGADILLRGGDYYRGEYRWFGGYYIKESGSSYIPDINKVREYLSGDRQVFSVSGSTFFMLTPGDVVYRNIDYGTGKRTVNVF